MITTAIMCFRGGPGRERDAALAWGFELRYYFLRGVGDEPPLVYFGKDGIYVCSGLMTTTHPGDTSPVTKFNGGDPADLDFVLNPDRMKTLRELYDQRRGVRFDGSTS